MISATEIADAKRRTAYGHGQVFHEHDDCIRLAYQWLDAQKRIAGRGKKLRPLKHVIERWAGRYVSQSDVEVAAELHPDIRGAYPYFNISARLIRPSPHRFEDISEANTQTMYFERREDMTYATDEISNP